MYTLKKGIFFDSCFNSCKKRLYIYTTLNVYSSVILTRCRIKNVSHLNKQWSECGNVHSLPFCAYAVYNYKSHVFVHIGWSCKIKGFLLLVLLDHAIMRVTEQISLRYNWNVIKGGVKHHSLNPCVVWQTWRCIMLYYQHRCICCVISYHIVYN